MLSVSVFIVGGIMVTLNARGQVSAALQMPMQFYYLGVPMAGFLMVFYTFPRLMELVKEFKEVKKVKVVNEKEFMTERRTV